MIVFPNAKINLGLQVRHKRPDGFHELETVFYPVALYDALEVVTEANAMDISYSGSGRTLDIPDTENICIKAYRLLQRDFPQLRPVRLHLHKQIPSGAGLGGGSADATFTLQLLNRKFSLGLTEEQLFGYALALGSDCPFFIRNSPCLATGRGEVLNAIDVDLQAYSLLLIYPGIHINTGWAFGQLVPGRSYRPVSTTISKDIQTWKDNLVNDFEAPVFAHYPEIGLLRDQLYEAGAIYAALSGSGSTVYGIFPKKSLPQLRFPQTYFVQAIN